MRLAGRLLLVCGGFAGVSNNWPCGGGSLVADLHGVGAANNKIYINSRL